MINEKADLEPLSSAVRFILCPVKLEFNEHDNERENDERLNERES